MDGCNFSAMPSPVWTYFKKMGKDSLCISCGKLVTSTNTTNMWFHLEKQHHKIYIDLKKKIPKYRIVDNTFFERIDFEGTEKLQLYEFGMACQLIRL
ncbi:hypothetical protein Bhyg_12425 [Pseudolycoriella hygida]|uniref:BED-type domain-containing protein n=1 Tax=Pseudolycoriella hygida TaxID=35572 RepID=A0A9Q0S193_9DIPT|nr:hypothetical protein Bhyg_12425 [Pseudolycoriella hygida]